MEQFKKWEKQIQDFCQARDWDQFHGPKDLAIGLSTEAAEVLECFRYKSEAECEALLGSEDGKKEVAFELADTLFHLVRFCQKYDIDIEHYFQEKMKINAERYSVEKAKGSNAKYDQLS